MTIHGMSDRELSR